MKNKQPNSSKKRVVLSALLTTDMSNRMLGRNVGMSHNTVRRYRNIVEEKNLTYVQLEAMDDHDIEVLLNSKRGYIEYKRMPDWEYIQKAMQQKHMTLQLLWEEYRLENPEDAYGYSQFTALYRRYVGKLDLAMRQTHRAGECVYVDFAGSTLSYTDPDTGKKHKVQIFVGVLGCSKYTFCYAVRSQSTADWIHAHNKMYHFFGGVPQVVVLDNLKAAVITAGREPVLNRTYLEQSKYYCIVVVPTRVARPQDKSIAELSALFVSRWILPILRRRQFFSIEEINEAIRELLRRLNERPFRKLPGCRRSRFLELDKPLLRPLPKEPFEYAEWVTARKVGQDYHLPYDNHYYSVPHELVGERVEMRATINTIEFIYLGRRVATHARSYVVGGHTTLPAHQPKAHRHYANLTPELMVEWAKQIGPSSVAVVEYQFESQPHSMLGLKACSSLKRLAKDYGHQHFEAACCRAGKIGSLTVKSIRSILQRRLTEIPDEFMTVQMTLPLHENVRGSTYYSKGVQ